MNKTYLTQDSINDIYAYNCNMWREFDTTYSNIPLKTRGVYKFNAGFKIYDDYIYATLPIKKGHKLGIEW